MLYTERSYFYRRYKVFLSFYIFDLSIASCSDQCRLLGFQIRGIKNLIFYSLPERKEFYPQVKAYIIN